MPKFYKQNKKRIDPRYFMDELLEEASDEKRHGPDPVSRHRDLSDPYSRERWGEEEKKEEEPKLPNAHQGEEGRMHRTLLAQLISDATMLLDMFDDTTDLPEWLEVKITKASDYIHSATSYLAGEKSREQGRLSKDTPPEYSPEGEAAIRDSVLGSMAKNPPSTPWSKGR